jgi:long-chain fatty acid transport protein
VTGGGAPARRARRSLDVAGRLAALGLVVTAALADPPPARAGGYAINDHGARAMAQGLATAATLQGPETLHYNPAGLSELHAWNLSFGSTLLLASFDSTPEFPGDVTWHSAREHFVVPHLYLGKRLPGRWSVGAAVNSPFGLATEWGKDFPGRFISRLADLKTLQLSGLLAVRLPRGWSVGFGPTLTHGDVHLVRDVDLSIFRFGHQAEADLTGDGSSLGWRAGARWRGASGWAFGAAFSGDTSIRYRGRVDYTVPLLGSFSLDQAITTLFQDGSAATTLTLPATAIVGVGRAGARWTWGADIAWTHWSVQDQVVIDLEPIRVGDESLVVPEFTTNDWRDTWAVRGGVRRKVSDRWSWSAGGYVDPTPVPVRTADPLLPDSDRVSVTGGVTLRFRRFTLDLAGQLVRFEKLDTRGTTNELSALYDASVAAIAVTGGWSWGASAP